MNVDYHHSETIYFISEEFETRSNDEKITGIQWTVSMEKAKCYFMTNH